MLKTCHLQPFISPKYGIYTTNSEASLPKNFISKQTLCFLHIYPRFNLPQYYLQNSLIISSFAPHHLKVCYILQFSPSRNLLSLSSPSGFCTSIHTPGRLKSPRFTTSALYAISNSLSLSPFNVSRETIQQQLRIIMAWYLRPWCRILHNALLKTRSNCHT